MRETLRLKAREKTEIQRSANKNNFLFPLSHVPHPKTTHPSNENNTNTHKKSKKLAHGLVKRAKRFALKLNKLKKVFFVFLCYTAVHVMESQLVEGRNLLFMSCCCVLSFSFFSFFLVYVSLLPFFKGRKRKKEFQANPRKAERKKMQKRTKKLKGKISSCPNQKM